MMCRLALIVALIAAAETRFGRPAELVEFIVRGDDMGWSHDTNLACIKAYKEGILTSVSVMVPGLYFDEAVTLCKANPGLAAGLHITLCDSDPARPVLPYEEIPSLSTPYGFFHLSRADFDRAKPTLTDIEKEVRAQIARARGSGLHFVYIDCHNMGTQKGLRPDIRELYVRIAKEERLLISTHEGEASLEIEPIRWFRPVVSDAFPRLAEGSEFIEEQRNLFFEKLKQLKSGLWLLVAHPGLYAPAHAREMYEMLLSVETKRIIKERGMRLVSYQDVWNRKYGQP
jgi:chitin disaccharide deacetylase